jgi:hypothetical protein
MGGKHLTKNINCSIDEAIASCMARGGQITRQVVRGRFAQGAISGQSGHRVPAGERGVRGGAEIGSALGSGS